MEASNIQFSAIAPPRMEGSVPGGDRVGKSDLAEASAQFEALLLRQFLSEALKPLTEGGDTFGGKSPIYGYFIVDTLATSLSESGSFGYSNLIQAQLAAKTSASNKITDDNLQ